MSSLEEHMDDIDLDEFEEEEVEEEAEILARLNREQLDKEKKFRELEKMKLTDNFKKNGYDYMEKLFNKRIKDAQPMFCSQVWKRRDLSMCLDRYFEYFLILVARGKYKLKTEEYPELCKAVDRINNLNDEIVENLWKLSGLPRTCLDLMKKKHMKAQLTKSQWESYKNNAIENPNVSEACQGDECNDRTCIYFFFLSGAGYDKNLKPLEDESMQPTIFCLCSAHLHMASLLFTFIHMKWNIFMNAKYRIQQLQEEEDVKNSDQMLLKIPISVKKCLTTEYMSRYYKLLIFGKRKKIKKWGLTMYRKKGFREVDDVEVSTLKADNHND